MAPELYTKLEFLGSVRKVIENLKEIKEYYSREYAVKGPFVEEGFFAF